MLRKPKPARLLATAVLAWALHIPVARSQAAPMTAAPPPPAPPQVVPDPPLDRGPQIMRMQLQSRGTGAPATGLSGAEGTLIYGRYLAHGGRPPNPATLGEAQAAPPPAPAGQ
jgi:hypothetical protein